jgi:hypothetical protein
VYVKMHHLSKRKGPSHVIIAGRRHKVVHKRKRRR